ncbi:MAG: twin-arginine translocation signal domain-containing protein [Deltaproteobacteria bacterium]|nr:twin-arginine translocation signal domain-containing protein [Deltaproteobacteria bacterium]
MIPLERALSGMNRRDFIRRSAAGLAGLTLAQALLPACSPGRAAPPDLRALGPVEFATLSAAADRIMDGMNYPGGADAVTILFDQDLARVPPWIRSLFIDAVRFLEFSPLLFSFPPGRFSTRSAEARDQILRDMAASALLIRRQVYAGIKQSILFTAYSQPATWAPLGYEGPGAVFERRGGKK